MPNIYFPNEEDFRKWIRESIRTELELLLKSLRPQLPEENEPLLSRHAIAKELGISLVTLTDWMKKGLPYLRMNGRVYFLRSEVIGSMYHNKRKSSNLTKDKQGTP